MDIIMPKMGESVNEGTIIKWHKKVGDSVKQDEIIFEISTDKVDTEIPSASAGVITEILVKEGETVEVGSVVARIQESGESSNSLTNGAEEIESLSDMSQEEYVISKDPESFRDEKSDFSINEQISLPINQSAERLDQDRNDINQTSTSEVSTKPAASGNVIEIAMPKMGESVMEGTIIKWHKKVGDAVKKDETIFEISTDKVDTEIPSPEAGTLAEILVGEQETVEVGTIVAKLSLGFDVQVSSASKKEIQQEKPVVDVPVSMHDNFSKTIETPLQEKGSASGFYSPLVLSIAQKENVSFDELQSITGIGLEGRVTKKDILAYIDTRKTQGVSQRYKNFQAQSTAGGQEKAKEIKAVSPASSFVPSTSQVVYNEADVERIPMDNIRQRIMDHMVHSRDTSVHVTSLIEVDMTRIHNFINVNKDEIIKSENARLTYMAFIADAVVKSLKKYPLVNSTIDGNVILQKKFINLGIAVALEPSGLIVPNIKGAGDRNIIGLAKAIADLANRARTKKLTPDDISNGTFTITNYGVFGTIFGTPIINQPEVAILGVGAVQKKPVVIEVDGSDTFAVRHIMALTLSHDHRLIDGMLGGLFLKNIKDILENFEGNL